MKIYIYILLFILFSSQVFAINPVLDSLKNELNNSAHDTIKLKIYNQIAEIYTKIKPDSTFIYTIKALNLSDHLQKSKKKEITIFAKRCKSNSYKIFGDYYKAIGKYKLAKKNYNLSIKILEKLNNENLIAKNYIYIGIIYQLESKYIEAERYFEKSVLILEKLNDQTGLSKVYRNFGNIYYYQGDYTGAIEYYEKSLVLCEANNDLSGVSKGYNNIGFMNSILKRDSLALDYFNKSLKIKEKLGDTRGIATAYNNIGDIYFKRKKLKDALNYYEKSLNLRKEAKAKRDIGISFRNIGRVFSADSNYVKSEEYFVKSLNIFVEIYDKEQESLLLADLASVKLILKKYDKTIILANRSLKIALQSKTLPRQQDAYKLLADAYEMKNNKTKAYGYLKKYIIAKDSIYERAAQKLIKSETRYKIGKKEKEVEAQKAINKNQQMQMMIMYGGIALMLILSFIFYRNFQQKTRANELLKKQKEEIETQKKEMTDSIIYAENIQRAVMPSDELMQDILSNYFMLFRPKDIVSGDFYWMKKIKNFIVIAIADCTGHGVPGAFMSMLGSLFLNESVTSRSLDSPGQILDKLREKIKKSLHQSGKEGEAKDGMDMTLFIIDIETLEMQFAGAFNPVYIIRENISQDIIDKTKEIKKIDVYKPKNIDTDASVIELKGDRQPIAIYTYEKPFNSYTIQLEKGDRVYSLSDGYPDQFGGSKGKKYKSRNLKDFLLKIYKEDMDKQKDLLNENFDTWKGDIAQIDDVILFGLNVDF